MWACINKKHDQNLIHSHTNNYNLSGVYYLNVPKDCGDIVFRDPRPGANQAPYRLFKDDGDSEYFTPFEGLIILFPSYLEHFVLPNRSDGDRISMSFDLTLERKRVTARDISRAVVFLNYSLSRTPTQSSNPTPIRDVLPIQTELPHSLPPLPM